MNGLRPLPDLLKCDTVIKTHRHTHTDTQAQTETTTIFKWAAITSFFFSHSLLPVCCCHWWMICWKQQKIFKSVLCFALDNDTVIISVLHVIDPWTSIVSYFFLLLLVIPPLLSFFCIFSKVTIVHCLNQHYICNMQLTIVQTIAHCSLFCEYEFLIANICLATFFFIYGYTWKRCKDNFLREESLFTI